MPPDEALHLQPQEVDALSELVARDSYKLKGNDNSASKPASDEGTTSHARSLGIRTDASGLSEAKQSICASVSQHSQASDREVQALHLMPKSPGAQLLQESATGFIGSHEATSNNGSSASYPHPIQKERAESSEKQSATSQASVPSCKAPLVSELAAQYNKRQVKATQFSYVGTMVPLGGTPAVEQDADTRSDTTSTAVCNELEGLEAGGKERLRVMADTVVEGLQLKAKIRGPTARNIVHGPVLEEQAHSSNLQVMMHMQPIGTGVQATSNQSPSARHPEGREMTSSLAKPATHGSSG